MRTLFVSYARENKSAVMHLVEQLRVLGCEAWFDDALRGGQHWWREILDKIAMSDAFVAVASAAAMNSTACQREFTWAEDLGRPILPVAVEALRSPLPRRYAERHYVDYAIADESATLALGNVIAALPAAPNLPDPLPEPPAPPLSYLTELLEVSTLATSLDLSQQHEVVTRLSEAIRAVDEEERRGGLELIRRFRARSDIHADVASALSDLITFDAMPSPPTVDATRASRPPSRAASGQVGLPPGLPSFDHSLRELAARAGKPQFELGKSGEAVPILTMKGQPRSLWVDVDDTVYIADGTATVRMLPSSDGAGVVRLSYRKAGRFARNARIKEFVMSDDGTAYALGDDYLFRRSPSGYARITGLHDPQGLAVSAGGDVYIADTMNNRIVVLTDDMHTQSDVALQGLWQPRGLAMDSAGILYVADSVNRRVIAFNPTTGAVRVLPLEGLYKPTAVAVDAHRLVYVTDAAHGRVHRFDVRNNEQVTLPFGHLLYPRAVAVDRHGAAYVAEAMGYRVLKLPAASR